MLSLLCVTTWLVAANPYLEEGRTLYSGLRYERAAEQLRLATQVLESTREERVESYDLLARSLVALGRMEEAKAAYTELLRQAPHAPPPQNAAPKIRALFTQAKEFLYPKDYVRLELQPAAPGRLAVRLIDPWGQVRSLWLQERGPRGYAPRPLARTAEGAGGELPAASGTGTVHLYVEARGEKEQVLTRLGSAEQPLEFRTSALPLVSAPPVTPGRKAPEAGAVVEATGPSWGGWAMVGVSVAAASAGTLLAVQSSRDSRAAGQAPWASETRALDAQARRKALYSHFLIGGALVSGAGAVVVFTTF